MTKNMLKFAFLFHCNRYPLHFVYALPKEQGEQLIKVILEKDANKIKNRIDEDGRVAADYEELRVSNEIKQMLYDAKGNVISHFISNNEEVDKKTFRGRHLDRWPKGTDHIPPTKQ